jgi:hypothetical protein
MGPMIFIAAVMASAVSFGSFFSSSSSIYVLPFLFVPSFVCHVRVFLCGVATKSCIKVHERAFLSVCPHVTNHEPLKGF